MLLLVGLTGIRGQDRSPGAQARAIEYAQLSASHLGNAAVAAAIDRSLAALAAALPAPLPAPLLSAAQLRFLALCAVLGTVDDDSFAAGQGPEVQQATLALVERTVDAMLHLEPSNPKVGGGRAAQQSSAVGRAPGPSQRRATPAAS